MTGIILEYEHCEWHIMLLLRAQSIKASLTVEDFNLVHDKRDTLGRGWELMYGASCWILVLLEPRSANRIAKTESVSE